MPSVPVRPRLPNWGSPPPAGSVAPLPMTSRVHSGAISRPSRLTEAYCGRTLLQSHCSSSHTIMALEVQTPWPSSVWAMRIVTVSSGATTTQALISSTAGSTAQAAPGGLMIWAGARCGTQKPTTSAPVAAAVERKSRRDRFGDRPDLTGSLSIITEPSPPFSMPPVEPPCGCDGRCCTGKHWSFRRRCPHRSDSGVA